jgi:hypothetical protein
LTTTVIAYDFSSAVSVAVNFAQGYNSPTLISDVFGDEPVDVDGNSTKHYYEKG